MTGTQHNGLGRPGRAVIGGLLLAAAVAPLSAQPIRFTQYSRSEGLSQVTVTSIVQDSRGFVWLGTEDGLNRFDGYEFAVYRRDAADITSLPDNTVWTVAEDAQGSLWIATEGGGIAKWDPPSETFERFRQRTEADFARVLHLDDEGMVWIGTRAAGLERRNPNTGTVESFRHDPSDPASLGGDAVYVICSTGDGRLWLGTDSGLDRFDPRTGTFSHLRHDPNDDSSLSDDRVRALLTDRDGTLWVGTYGGGLARLLPSGEGFEHFRHDSRDPHSLAHDRVRSLLEDDAGRLWVGTAGGLSLYDAFENQFQSYHHDPADPTSLSDNHVMSLYQDGGGVLWVGTRTGGLNAWHPNLWSFGHVARGPGALRTGAVTSFVEGDRGQLWIGTFGGGLHLQDRATGEMRYFQHDPDATGSLSSDHVMALEVDGRGQLWAGTMDAGLNRYDATSETFERIELPQGVEGRGSESVTSLLTDARGRLWIGTFGGGLLQFDPRNKTFESFMVGEKVMCLAEDREGRLWFGTNNQGLVLFDRQPELRRRFRHDPDDATSLGADGVSSLYARTGRLWVGTRGGGLARLDLEELSDDSPSFRTYTLNDGLSNDMVYGIEPDTQDRLWLSTNFGLSVFDPDEETFTTYQADQGLQLDEFNFGAHYSSSSGELFFGGVNGFNAFYPHQLARNEHAPDVVLTAVLERNEPVADWGPASQIEELSLGWREDVLTLEFAALDFAAPQRNRYRYRLAGFDEEWIQLGLHRRVSFTDLDGGDYIFQVQASNNDGVWSEEGLELPITVAPPPWKSWWAGSLYFMVGFVGLGGASVTQHRKLQREQEYSLRLEAEVQTRTEALAERASELACLNRDLADASLTDPLTGLRNRRFLFEHIGEETSLVERRYSQLAQGVGLKAFDLVFMMVDLDSFKEINDTCGHLAGDHVLMQLREVLESSCRESDLIIRWGGDEFLIIGRDSSPALGQVLAQRVLQRIREHVFTLEDGRVVRATCSIGFACFPFVREEPDALSWEDVLAMADCALYAAKYSSRDAWVGLASTETTSGDVISRLRHEPAVAVGDNQLEVHTSLDDETKIVWSEEAQP